MSDTFLPKNFLPEKMFCVQQPPALSGFFETFPSECLSFSDGKDSTVLFHLVAEVVRRRKRRFSVLFIDREA